MVRNVSFYMNHVQPSYAQKLAVLQNLGQLLKLVSILRAKPRNTS